MPEWIEIAGEWLQGALPYVAGALIVLLLLAWVDRHRAGPRVPARHDGADGDDGEEDGDDGGGDGGH